MKKIFRYLFLILVVGLLTFNIYQLRVSADSGFGGSYGGSSGGSSYGGGYSGGYSGGSYGSHSSLPGEIISTSLLLVIVLIIYFLKSPKRGNSLPKRLLKESTINDEEFKQLINMSKDEFYQLVFKIYRDVQIAWMNFDYDTLQNNLTNDLFNMYKSQLETLKIKNQTNVMKNIICKDTYISNINSDDNTISIKVGLTVTCKDYIVDKNNRVVRGNANNSVEYQYLLTLIRNKEIKTTIECPHCGASVNLNASSVCEYCHSTIISNTHDWVLSKKITLNQRSLN